MRRFAFRLARDTDRIEVDREVLAVLTRAQLIEWMAYYELEPNGPDRDDTRTALHTAKLLNQWIKEPENRHKAADLIIEWGKTTAASETNDLLVTDEQMQAGILTRFG